MRWRIVYHGITINLPLVNIAQNLNVQYCRYRLFEESGTVDPRSPSGSVVGDLIYVVNCMLSKLFSKTDQCTYPGCCEDMNSREDCFLLERLLFIGKRHVNVG